MPKAVVIDEILTAVRDTVRGLSLSGISSGSIVRQLVGDAEGGNGPTVPGYPCVLIYPACPESDAGGTNLRDNWVYPVGVAIIAQEPNRNASANISRNLGWRQSIRDTFHQQRFSGVTGGAAWNCTVRPGTPADVPRWMEAEHAQLLILSVTVLEQRG